MPVAVFDLYYLLVENVFGSVLFSGVGLAVAFSVMMLAAKMSPRTVVMLIIFFVGTFSIGYIGEFGALLVFLFCGFYFITSLGKFIFRSMG